MIPEDRLGEPGVERTRTRFHIVTPGYFRTLGVPILSGLACRTAISRPRRPTE